MPLPLQVIVAPLSSIDTVGHELNVIVAAITHITNAAGEARGSAMIDWQRVGDAVPGNVLIRGRFYFKFAPAVDCSNVSCTAQRIASAIDCLAIHRGIPPRVFCEFGAI